MSVRPEALTRKRKKKKKRKRKKRKAIVKRFALHANAKKTLNIKFHSMPVYDEKYIKAKVREFNGVIKTNFLGDEIPKENVHYTCIACITIDSVMRMKKKIIHKFI